MTSRKENGYDKMLPQRIRAQLDKQKMKRSELAERIGVSRQQIGYYCDGINTPDAEKLASIATALNVSADYLLGLSDSEKNNEKQSMMTYADIVACLDEILSDLPNWYIQPNEYETQLPEREPEKEYQLILNMGDDSKLYNYYHAIGEMQNELSHLPPDKAIRLLYTFKIGLRQEMLSDEIFPF